MLPRIENNKVVLFTCIFIKFNIKWRASAPKEVQKLVAADEIIKVKTRPTFS